MSTILLFRGKYLRYNVNIQDCFTVERQDTLRRIAMSARPWAAGLTRLLNERRMKKGELAALCQGKKVGTPMRAGTVSAVLNSARPPDISTLLRLVAGFERWAADPKHPERKALNLPRVELWEFFVTDEQSALLRKQMAQQDALTTEDDAVGRVKARALAELMEDYINRAAETELRTPLEPATKKSEDDPPAPVIQPVRAKAKRS